MTQDTTDISARNAMRLICSANLKTRAEENNVADACLGLKYRQEILSRGATKSGEKMLTSFLGRAQSKILFFERLK